MLKDEIKKKSIKKRPKIKQLKSTRINLSKLQLRSCDSDNSIESKSKQIMKLNF